MDATDNTVEKAKAWETALHLKTKARLSAAGIRAGHALFGRMLDASGQTLNTAQLEDEIGINDDQRDALVKANILASHVNETYTCAARYVVGAFESLRQPRPLLSWLLDVTLRRA